MNKRKDALNCAVRAARAAGQIIRKNQFSEKKIDFASQHDIKLELDVLCQKKITTELYRAFPDIALLGEEGESGETNCSTRWVVDPIDGTVNFSYGIPHACVSIALQERAEAKTADAYPDGYRSTVGVVYDPFCDELWTAVHGESAKLNGKPVRVSTRTRLEEAVVSVGFAKSKENLDFMLPFFNQLVHRVRKIRMMGAAALALTYVASGRFDIYVERGIRLWDVAAGGLIVQRAGGEFWCEAVKGEHTYRMVASNGLLRKKLPKMKV
jgi:myo-inositol-1(or 4)-monophosphatase